MEHPDTVVILWLSNCPLPDFNMFFLNLLCSDHFGKSTVWACYRDVWRDAVQRFHPRWHYFFGHQALAVAVFLTVSSEGFDKTNFLGNHYSTITI